MSEGYLHVQGLNVFYRETGAGPPVILLHCTGGASGQWRKFMERMSDRYRLIAADALSHGKSDKVPADTDDELELEVRVVLALVEHVGEPVHLVGHSSGAAAATRFAEAHPEQVVSLAICEPTLFQLLANGVDEEGWTDFMRLVTGLVGNADAGNLDAAAETLIDYWSKSGAYAVLPPEQQDRIKAAVPASASKARRITASPERGLIDPQRIRVPTVIVSGEASPRSARGVVEILASKIPGARLFWIEGAGHMAPLTHADAVNRIFEEHIEAAGAS